MAEENKTPEQSESPIFKVGEAVDRAKIEGNVLQGFSEDEDIQKLKYLNRVSKEAKSFFRKNYKETLTELDPESSKTPWYYQFAYSPVGSSIRKIEKTLEAGEALDGAKDIVPMAQKAAQSKVSSAQALKVGTVTEIVDMIGSGEVQNMSTFSNVKEEFDSKVKDEKKSFEVLYNSFKENIGLFQRDLSMLDDRAKKTLFSPENNAIISALAKVLKGEGIENESVNYMNEKFEEYLNALATGTPAAGEKMEAAKAEAPKEPEKETGTEAKVEETKLEEKLEEKKEAPVTPAPEEKPIEGAKAEAPPETTTAGPAPEAKAETPALAVPEVPKPGGTMEGAAAAPTPVTPPKGAAGEEAKTAAMSAIEGIFGGATSLKTPETGEGAAKSASSLLESSPALQGYSSMIDSLFGAGTFSSLPIPGMGAVSEIAGGATDLTKKISTTGETLTGSAGIKETGVQKLASPLPTPATKPTVPTPTETKVSPTPSAQEQSTSASPVEEGMETTQETKPSGQAQSPATEEGGSELGEKLNLMVNLLTQLNDTLQNPLIVTTTNKNF